MKKRPPAPRHTQAARVEIILELVVAGLNARQIRDQVAKQYAGWKATPETLARYVAEARKTLAAEPAPNRREEFAKAIRRLDTLYARCMQLTDYGKALAVEQARIKLLSLIEGTAPRPHVTLDALIDAVGRAPARLNVMKTARPPEPFTRTPAPVETTRGNA